MKTKILALLLTLITFNSYAVISDSNNFDSTYKKAVEFDNIKKDFYKTKEGIQLKKISKLKNYQTTNVNIPYEVRKILITLSGAKYAMPEVEKDKLGDRFRLNSKAISFFNRAGNNHGLEIQTKYIECNYDKALFTRMGVLNEFPINKVNYLFKEMLSKHWLSLDGQYTMIADFVSKKSDILSYKTNINGHEKPIIIHNKKTKYSDGCKILEETNSYLFDTKLMVDKALNTVIDLGVLYQLKEAINSEPYEVDGEYKFHLTTFFSDGPMVDKYKKTIVFAVIMLFMLFIIWIFTRNKKGKGILKSKLEV